jgi:methyltransferase (TIGR00027 family)
MTSELTFEEDLKYRLDPASLTRWLQGSVPLLTFTDFRITHVEEGFVCGELPLSAASSNQHFTHQAASYALAADYVGGILLATAFRGVPLVGIHPRRSDTDASLWLMKMDVTYKAPSTSDLIVSARSDPKRLELLGKRFAQGKAVIERVTVILENDGQVVAEAEMTYYARQVRALRPGSPEQSAGTLFKHFVSLSARLIAGLRALESDAAKPLFRDEFASIAAGAQGRLLAQRFNEVLPQLRQMVAARTRNIDDLIVAALADGVDQIVFVGAGLDFRLARHPHACDVTVFELDLPHMLAAREQILASVDADLPNHHRPVPINLEMEDLAAMLISHGLDPQRPALFIAEGLSMYMSAEVNQRIFQAIRSLMHSPRSRFWVDLVAEVVVSGTSDYQEVEAFVRRMASIGEPFIFGLDDPGAFAARVGLAVAQLTGSGAYHAGSTHPIFDLYRFVLFAPEPGQHH